MVKEGLACFNNNRFKQNYKSHELNIYLKYYFCSKIEEEFGNISMIRQRFIGKQDELIQILFKKLEKLRYSLDIVSLIKQTQINIQEDLLEKVLNDRDYIDRIILLVIEQIISERVSPELEIYIEPVNILDIDPEFNTRVNHGVIFDLFINFTNELFPLMIDAFVSDQSGYGRQVINVIGVHYNWLDNNFEACRIIHYNHLTEEFMEMSLIEPIPIHTLHYLCITKDNHKKVSERAKRFDIFEINPYESLEFVNNKIRMLRILERNNIKTPKGLLVSVNKQISDISQITFNFI